MSKARVFWINLNNFFVLEDPPSERVISAGVPYVKLIEAEPVLEELRAVRESINNLNNACEGEIGCWCGETIRGEEVEICPRCAGEESIINLDKFIKELEE